MSDGKGYLIPDNPTPDDERCILVFIPDDDFYLYAFMGAYRLFGKWIAWERDDDKRGKIAAERWRQSIECTEDFMSNCGVDLANAINNVADAILNKPCCDSVTTVNVNTPVTVNIDPSDDGQPPTLSPDPIGDPNTDPPPTGYDDWPTYKDDRCKASNYYADQVIEMVRKLENIGDVVLVVSVVVAAISLFFPPAFLASMGTIALLGLAADIIALGLVGDFAFNHMITIADDMESDKEGLVCALYKASSALEMGQQAVDWFTEKIDATAITLGWSTETTNKVKALFNKYFGDYIIEWFEASFVDVVPPGYVGGVDCVYCEDLQSMEWDFDDGVQGWVFETDYYPNTTTGDWVTGLGYNGTPCLRISHPADPVSTSGEWAYYMTGDKTVKTGDYVEARLANRSDATNSYLYLHYRDGTYDRVNAVNSSTNFINLTVVVPSSSNGKILDRIELVSQHGTGQSGAGFWLWDLVRLTVI